MTDEATVTLHVGSISVVCDATVDAARVQEMRDAIPRAVQNWSDVIDLLRKMDASPVVQIALLKGQIYGLIHTTDTTATVVDLPAKAKGYDVLAKILRELEHSCKGPR